MSWRFVRKQSITSKLLLIFISSTLLILSMLTLLVYPTMRTMLSYARSHHDEYAYTLSQICINKLFIGIWISTLIVIVVSYWLARKSLQPIAHFTEELASVSARTLDKRLPETVYPKELQELVTNCNEMLFRIEKGVNHIKQFSTAMAHELRNPLHYLRNATEITLAHTQTPEHYQQILASHLDEFQHLSQLIDKLLFLARSERGQLQLNKQMIAGRDLIDSVIDYYAPVAEEKQIAIVLRGEGQMFVDPSLFKQVIANLLENSLAYTDPNGEICILVETVSTQTLIHFQDTGMGIAQEHLPYLAQGFYRVGSSQQNNNAGLGLGLAIAQSILENHGAEFKIQSELGKGTCISVIVNN